MVPASQRKQVGALVVATKGDRELALTRVFDAPRDLVFRAWTAPDLIRRWLTGPPGWSMPVCEQDLRVGGRYRYVWRNTEGAEMGVGGVYQDIVAPERLVATEVWDEPWYPGESLVTIAFAEQAGGTTVTTTIRYQSAETRDAVFQSPMAGGASQSYDRLAEVLASPRADTVA